ncbi:hypothetical protein MMC31_005733, partial [Peltigera leucophlebia]|nr:hypothetical protein [Peltigera leucophlebia]
FRSLLRQSNQFASYNFREYAKRRTKDSFREHRGDLGEREAQDRMQEGLKELQAMKVRTRLQESSSEIWSGQYKLPPPRT